jgi:hypothetical protein
MQAPTGSPGLLSLAHTPLRAVGYVRAPARRSRTLLDSEHATESRRWDEPDLQELLMPPLGLEPRTFGLKVRCSTN